MINTRLLNFPSRLAEFSASFLDLHGYVVEDRISYLPDSIDDGVIVYYAPDQRGFIQGEGNTFEHTIAVTLRGITTTFTEQYVLCVMLASEIIRLSETSNKFDYKLELERDSRHVQDGKDRFKSTIYFKFIDTAGK